MIRSCCSFDPLTLISPTPPLNILSAKSWPKIWHLVPAKIAQIFAVLGSGISKSSHCTKARHCVNPRRLSYFVSKSVERCDPQVGWEKSKKVTETPTRKTLPLIQGLNYRSACDCSLSRPQKGTSLRETASYIAIGRWNRFSCFYRAMHFSAKRGLAIACRVSVCLSVCPSVTLVDCDHTCCKSWKLTARTISPTPSLFAAKRRSTYSQGNMGTFWGD